MFLEDGIINTVQKRIVEAMDSPVWESDKKFSSFEGRKQYEDEIDMNISEWTSKFEPWSLQEKLQGSNIPAGIVANTKDLHEDPQLVHRNHFRVLNHSTMGDVPYDGPSFRLPKTPDNHRYF